MVVPTRFQVWFQIPVLALLFAAPAHGETDIVLRLPREILDGNAAATAEVVVRGPWGAETGAFGKVDEASRPGPMDFAVVNETLYVLDPVNERVQLFGLDGGFRSEIPIGSSTADFLCVDQQGCVTVLDAFVRREFMRFAADGRLLSQARLPSGIELPSAIFADGERVWVESRHNRVYELSVTQREPGAAARIVEALPGRPLGRDRGTCHARKRGAHGVVLQRELRAGAVERLAIEYPCRVASIVALEADAHDRTYLAAAILEPGTHWKTRIVVVVVTPDNTISATMQLPDNYVTDHYRKLLVTPDGDVVQMQTSEEEVRFVRWTLPAGDQGRDVR